MTRPSQPAPSIDYTYLPGEEHNPLMESTLHVKWGTLLLGAAQHELADTDCLVTGNVAFAPDDGGPFTAPDLMVIPGAKGTEFGRYEPGRNDPLPSACVEILSPSNTRADIARRNRRLLRLGVAEVYTLDPVRETVVRVTIGNNDELVETNAIGHRSAALRLSFVRIDGALGVCCPAGRVARPGDDPYGWLVQEQTRADTATAHANAETARADAETARADAEAERADAEAARADQLDERSRALEAELERLRSQLPGSP